MFLRNVAVSVIAVVIIGCSDPKAANEGNFKISVQAYLDKSYPKCYLNTEFPTTVNAFDAMRTKNKLRALEKVGLVSEKEESHEIKDFFGKRTVTETVFDLTDEGRNYYKKDVDITYGGKSVGGFCFGKAKVNGIEQFTEPSDLFGQKVSRVSYTYEVYDLPEWARNPDVVNVIDSLKADVDSSTTPVKRMEALILTNNGWVHERLFK